MDLAQPINQIREYKRYKLINTPNVVVISKSNYLPFNIKIVFLFLFPVPIVYNLVQT